MTLRLLLALALLPALLHASPFFPTRSGDVQLLASSPPPSDDAGVVSFISPTGTTSLPSSVSLLDLASIAKTQLRLPTSTPSPLPSPPSLFSAPSAHLTLTVPGLGKAATTSRLSSIFSRLSSLASSHGVVEVSLPYRAPSSLSLLASLATGQPASRHGLVDRTWFSTSERESGVQDTRVVEAFEAPLEQNAGMAFTVADVAATEFEGEAMTLSFSADRHYALAASSLNAMLEDAAVAVPKKQFIVSLDDKATSAMSPEEPFRPSRAQILAWLQDPETSVLSDAQHVGAAFDAAAQTVTIGDSPAATFDLSNAAHYALFAELQVAKMLPSLVAEFLRKHPQAGAPSVYSVTLAGFERLLDTMDVSPVEVRGAALLVDAVVPVILARFADLHDGRVVSQLVLPGHHSMLARSQPSRDMRAHLSAAGDLVASALVAQRIAYTRDGAHFSLDDMVSVSGITSSVALRKLCATLRDEVRAANTAGDVELVCPALMHDAEVYHKAQSPLQAGSARTFSLLLLEDQLRSHAAAAATVGADPVSSDEIELYQITLWLSIVLIFVVLAASYSMAYMDNERDSLLYARFTIHSGNQRHHM